MFIDVFGRRPAKVDRTEILKAARTYLLRLIPDKRKLKGIDIEIHIVKDLEKENKVRGQVEAQGTKSFLIFLDDKMSKKMTLMTLAHEMVHVQQYATGRLYQYKGSRWETVRWDSKVIKFNVEDDEEYRYAPWEIEARGYEEALYYSYIGKYQD